MEGKREQRMTLKCLSIRPPWPWLIIKGHKPVENRGWQSHYRGPLLIHVAKTFDHEGYRWIQKEFPDINLPPFVSQFFHPGRIIGQVEMVSCVTELDSPWFSGPYGFVFTHPIEFEKPVRWRGERGIFNVPDEVLKVTA